MLQKLYFTRMKETIETVTERLEVDLIKGEIEAKRTLDKIALFEYRKYGSFRKTRCCYNWCTLCGYRN